MRSDFPRVVAFGDGAGISRILTGLAAHMRGEEHDRRHDLLTAIVASAAGVEEADSLVGHCACVLPATENAGAVRRAHPEALRRIINADVIVAVARDVSDVRPVLTVGGMAATLAAVVVPRVFVAPPARIAPLLPIYRRPPALASLFDRVLLDPGATPDPDALARAILALVRPGRLDAPAA
jgi:2-phospho-L-lactate transferase/gluconeogenesis factor (CofD/UPF0052 family)